MRDGGSGPKRSKMSSYATPKLATSANGDQDSHRNRLSVASDGSPRYAASIATSARPRLSAKPIMTSKIPLPTLSRSPSPLAKATNKPRKPADRRSIPWPPSRKAPSPLSQETKSPVSMTPANANVHKPLPSAPVAQFVNPTSPPKVSRTLVDATVSTTPKDEEWPVISPENVSKSHSRPPSRPSSRALSANNPYAKYVTGSRQIETIQRRDASGGSANTHASTITNEDIALSVLKHPRRSAPEEVRRHASSEHRQSNVMRPSAIGHAISTPHNEAVQSPLTHKLKANGDGAKAAVDHTQQSNKSTIFIPLKKQPVGKTEKALSPITSGMPIVRRRSFRPGSTKWPSLDDSCSTQPGQNDGEQMTAPINSQTNVADIYPDLAHSHRSISLPQKTANNSGVDSASETSSFEEESKFREVVTSSGDRIRNLSTHNLRAGVGPVLRIAGDADSVIMGRSASTPDLPMLPDTSSQNSSGKMSFASLAGRISRQTMSITGNKRARSATPASAEVPPIIGSPTRVPPIRAMQPSRKFSADRMSKTSSASSSRQFVVPRKLSGLGDRRPGNFSSHRKSSVPTSVLQASGRSKVASIKVPLEVSGPAPPAPSQIPSGSGSRPIGIRKRAPIRSYIRETANDDPLSEAEETFLDGLVGISTPGEAADVTPPSNERFTFHPSNGTRATPPSSVRFATPASNGTRATPPSSGRIATSVRFTTPPDKARLTVPPRASSIVPRNTKMNTGNMTGTIAARKSSTAVSVTTDGGAPPTESRPISSASHLNFQVAPDEVNGESGENQEPAHETGKLRLKRSIRNLFPKRDCKNANAAKPNETKRMSMTGNALARRFRSSANASKPSLPDEMAAKPEEKHAPKPANGANVDAGHHARSAIPKLKASASSSEDQSAMRPEASATRSAARPATMSDAPELIDKLIQKADSFPEDSEERMRGIQIAQVRNSLYHHSLVMMQILTWWEQAIVNVIDMTQLAMIASEKAQKQARDAALCSEGVGMAVQSLVNALGMAGTLDDETTRDILELCHNAGFTLDREDGGHATKK
ncbi:hypothetical protein BDV96DRAFT_642327 [Lophiotrema nucula]|uniref:Uncharacterized protein n=1 Tax=Lophiotrema nucula TaxID=690887 RepID=A0A6A5ZM19_9PLEO|nr:hypothetical protein BDV96DRAFT_642327 [Lophiotrema nucula]